MNAVLERTSAPVTEPKRGTAYAALASTAETDPFVLSGISIPRWLPPTVRNFSQMARDIQAWTGWSLRALAEAVGTTHPTIRQILDGVPQVGTRNTDLLRRLDLAHGVVARIYVVAGRESSRTAFALASPSVSGTAVALLASGQSSRAYLTALDALRPARPEGLLVGSRPLRPGTGTVDYLDEG